MIYRIMGYVFIFLSGHVFAINLPHNADYPQADWKVFMAVLTAFVFASVVESFKGER